MLFQNVESDLDRIVCVCTSYPFARLVLMRKFDFVLFSCRITVISYKRSLS